MQYLRQSQHEILKEEERRYRFLAEKHCGLTQSLLYLINKVQLLSTGVHQQCPLSHTDPLSSSFQKLISPLTAQPFLHVLTDGSISPAESRWMERKSQREQKFQTSNAHSIRSRSSGDTGMMGMRSKYSMFPHFFMLFSANCRAQTFPQSHNVNRWVALCGVESKITFLSHLFIVGEFTSHEIVFCIT